MDKKTILEHHSDNAKREIKRHLKKIQRNGYYERCHDTIKNEVSSKKPSIIQEVITK